MPEFITEWWRCNIPDDWKSDDSEGCATFTSKNGFGALQISAFKKEDREVTDEDLRDFASDHVNAGANLSSVSFGDFIGLYVAYSVEDQEFWCEYWLRSGQVMIYVTYNCLLSEKENELSTIEDILDSLGHDEIKKSQQS